MIYAIQCVARSIRQIEFKASEPNVTSQLAFANRCIQGIRQVTPVSCVAYCASLNTAEQSSHTKDEGA